MLFKNTKKFFIDCASLRVDIKIKNINSERAQIATTEYYWMNGKSKKMPKRYGRLTNKKVSPTNPPLIGSIRNGKITSKNPNFFTPYSITDIYNNCKLSPINATCGLSDKEFAEYRQRNLMFESYNELCLGDKWEHRDLESFLSTAIILDILFEEYDEKLWRIILGYLPLNIVFEKIRLNVVEVKKVYGLLVKDNWELLLTGIFRASERALNVGGLFWEFHEVKGKFLLEGNNKLLNIAECLTQFYTEILRNKIDDFIKENSYFGYKDKYILNNSAYQSMESLISIQQDMHRYQKSTIDSTDVSLDFKKDPWEFDFLTLLEKRNTKEKLYDSGEDLLNATRVLHLVQELLDSLVSFQNHHEDSDHWGGNYLGYVKKYQHGNEIVEYFKTSDRELLRPLIEKHALETSVFGTYYRASQNFFIKTHPNSWLANEDRSFHQDLMTFRNRNKSKKLNDPSILL